MKKRIELEALITEREAMKAANEERLSNGEGLAYGEEAFFDLAKRIEKLLPEIPVKVKRRSFTVPSDRKEQTFKGFKPKTCPRCKNEFVHLNSQFGICESCLQTIEDNIRIGSKRKFGVLP